MINKYPSSLFSIRPTLKRIYFSLVDGMEITIDDAIKWQERNGYCQYLCGVFEFSCMEIVEGRYRAAWYCLTKDADSREYIQSPAHIL